MINFIPEEKMSWPKHSQVAGINNISKRRNATENNVLVSKNQSSANTTIRLPNTSTRAIRKVTAVWPWRWKYGSERPQSNARVIWDSVSFQSAIESVVGRSVC
ncbi:hypothetical protein TNCV_3340731 [Trichonephila clavipes]|nr:hypothetical protein TNCV_3340731 [Trichonephila clavipes]